MFLKWHSSLLRPEWQLYAYAIYGLYVYGDTCTGRHEQAFSEPVAVQADSCRLKACIYKLAVSVLPLAVCRRSSEVVVS